MQDGAGSVAVSLPTTEGVDVVVCRRDGVDVLEARASAGGILGHYDPMSGRLHIVEPIDSVRVAGAIAPYLLGGDQPFGDLSDRHLHAADRLWSTLENSPYMWQRSVPLHGRLLVFYSPLIRIVLEIVDHSERATDVDVPMLNTLGLALAVIPIRDIECDVHEVVGWVEQVCASRADNRPGTQVGEPQRHWRARRRATR